MSLERDESPSVARPNLGPSRRNPRVRMIRHGTIDLSIARRIVGANWTTVLVATLVGASLAIGYLHLTHWKYAVRMYITSAEPAAHSSHALSALSSLAGISMGQGENPNFVKFLAAIRSPMAARSVVTDQGVLRAMFPQEWSARANAWREPNGFVHSVAVAVKRMLGIPLLRWGPPGAAQVYVYLRDNLKVIPDEKSGIVMLEIDSRRPGDAKKILQALNQVTDAWMRRRDLQHASQDIQFLSRQLALTTVQDLHVALAMNLAQQEKAEMLASSPLPYVSDVLGPPIVSQHPVSPRPLAAILAGIVTGFAFGFALAARKFTRQ